MLWRQEHGGEPGPAAPTPDSPRGVRGAGVEGHSMALERPTLPEDPYYEETVTESSLHFRVLNYLYCALDERYRERTDVFVVGNHFVYWVDGDQDQRQAPDIFVCFGAEDVDRKSYRVGVSGPAPQVVIEVTSESSRLTDQGTKRGAYEIMGVEEYYLFDPLGEYITGKLRGFRREQDILLPVVGADLYSPRLDLDLKVEGQLLRLYDHASGRPLGSYREERARAEQERARADQEKARADQEKTRADQLAQRLRELGHDADCP